MVHDQTETAAGIVDGGIFQHGFVAIAVAEARDRASPNELMNGNRLSLFVIDKQPNSKG